MLHNFDEARRLNVFYSVYDLISGVWPTPLVRLRKFGDVWAKLEFFNAASRSIKDRFAWYAVSKLKDRIVCKRVEEPSSGNFGTALAVLSRQLGFDLRLYLPMKRSRRVDVVLKVLGVEVVELEFDVLDQNFINYVKDVAKRSGSIMINQFENDDNPLCHYEITGAEIARQLRAVGRRPDVLIAGVGTSGHIVGISRRLREEFGDVVVVGVTPSKDSYIPGIKRIEHGVKWISSKYVDEVIEVSLEESIEGVIEVGRSEGLLIGLSSGAVFQAYKKVREKYGDRTYVLVFPDDIFKYLDIIGDYLSKSKACLRVR